MALSCSNYDTKILEFNQHQKSDKTPFIIYAGLECLIEKIDAKNDPENSSTAKLSKHVPSSFPMSTVSLFRKIENKYDVYRGKDCMKKFCESLREQHALKVINFKKKKMKLLTKEQHESYENTKTCYICKEKFENKYLKDNKYRKVKIVVIIQRNIEVLGITNVI